MDVEELINHLVTCKDIQQKDEIFFFLRDIENQLCAWWNKQPLFSVLTRTFRIRINLLLYNCILRENSQDFTWGGREGESERDFILGRDPEQCQDSWVLQTRHRKRESPMGRRQRLVATSHQSYCENLMSRTVWDLLFI